ncbi:MAG: EAL domain-containing protein [Betaproteobacteria bacterium]|nr:EAL domain-containing protein [Betaproteobacteria bacterium]
MRLGGGANFRRMCFSKVFTVDTNACCAFALIRSCRRLQEILMQHKKVCSLSNVSHNARVQSLAGLGSWVLDFASGQVRLSAEAARIYGLPESEMLRSPLALEQLNARINGADRPRVEANWCDALGGKPHDIEFRLPQPGGELRWVWQKASIEFDGRGRPVCATGIVQDITRRRQEHAEKMNTAHRDLLTALPNRSLLAEFLAMAIPLARRNRTVLAVLFIDLDRFKQVNDELGHGAGDELLRQVAKRMKASLRASDIVARQGGDEFVVVLQNLAHESEAGLVALTLIEELSRPFDLAGLQARIGASVGIALFPGDSNDIETLFCKAALAMYQAKAAGRQTPTFFDPVMQRETLAKRALESDLQQALENQELVLHYQPILELPHQRLARVEALIRWNHPEHGLIGPEVFLQAAEDSGLINPIGCWIITEVCRQINAWLQEGRKFAVSINVSSRQVPNGIPADWLRDTLARFNVHPGSLSFEISESALIKDVPAVSQWLRDIDEMQIRVAIDDFGSGPASLSSLRQHRLHQIKIDKSLVLGMSDDARTRTLVKSIVEIGQNMGLGVTAEGVEDADTLEALQSIGCGFAQGMHLAPPMPPEKLLNFGIDTAMRSRRIARQAMLDTDIALSPI